MSDLLSSIERLRNLPKETPKPSGSVKREVTAIHWFVMQIIAGLWWFYDRIVRPVSRLYFKPIRWLFWRYRVTWDSVVYRIDGTFSMLRAGLMVTATIASLWVVPALLGFVWECSVYILTAKRGEVIYLTQSQEIDPVGNVWSVQGCTALPCTDQNSINFRVNPTLFTHLWSLIHNGNVFFPDYVGASVPPGLNKCVITSYGVRWKFLMRGLDVYPDILEASCEPVKND